MTDDVEFMTCTRRVLTGYRPTSSPQLRAPRAQQATEIDPERDAEPGKILHEMRQGEMARLGEVPFARYYGSVDATPLFVVLASAYYTRTELQRRAGSGQTLPPTDHERNCQFWAVSGTTPAR